jgi:hypothetical protein
VGVVKEQTNTHQSMLRNPSEAIDMYLMRWHDCGEDAKDDGKRVEQKAVRGDSFATHAHASADGEEKKAENIIVRTQKRQKRNLFIEVDRYMEYGLGFRLLPSFVGLRHGEEPGQGGCARDWLRQQVGEHRRQQRLMK